MKIIKLWFTDFYDGFDPGNNYFFKLLSEYYIIELDPDSPDYIIYSCYGKEFLKYDCIRIFYTGENLIPDFNLCDFAIGFSYLDFNGRYLRFPNFVFYEDQFEKLILPESRHKETFVREHFCNFIYSNANADPTRDHFFQLLNSYKKVLSPGTHLNNYATPVGERFSNDWMFTKIDFQSRCKFSIAFENTSSPGYTTEKILHAFISHTIPIYWGNPKVSEDFNNKAFINCHEFKNFDQVIEKVKEIDQNEDLFLAIINEPPFKNNEVPQNLQPIVLSTFLKKIFDQPKKEARQRPFYGTIKNYEKSLKTLITQEKKQTTNSGIYKFLLPFRK